MLNKSEHGALKRLADYCESSYSAAQFWGMEKRGWTSDTKEKKIWKYFREKGFHTPGSPGTEGWTFEQFVRDAESHISPEEREANYEANAPTIGRVPAAEENFPPDVRELVFMLARRIGLEVRDPVKDNPAPKKKTATQEEEPILPALRQVAGGFTTIKKKVERLGRVVADGDKETETTKL